MQSVITTSWNDLQLKDLQTFFRLSATSGKHWNWKTTQNILDVSDGQMHKCGVPGDATSHRYNTFNREEEAEQEREQEMRGFIYRLEVEQRVHGSGLGLVVLVVHLSPVFRPPLRDQDGAGCRHTTESG